MAVISSEFILFIPPSHPLCFPLLMLYFLQELNFQNLRKELPGWLSGKESACQCRRHGFSPWPGKIPYAAEQPSASATTPEPLFQRPCSAHSKKSLHKATLAHCNQRVASTHYKRKACTATKTHQSRKERQTFIKHKGEKAVKKKKKRKLANMQKSWKNGSQYLYTYHLDSAIYICYTYHIVNLSIHVHFFFKKNLFFCCTGSSWLLHGLSLVAVSGGCSLVVLCGPLIMEASLVAEHMLQVCGFQDLWHTSPVALRHVELSGLRIKPLTGRFLSLGHQGNPHLHFLIP